MTKNIGITIALLFPMLSQAELLFYCKTANGKLAKIEKQGHFIDYAFGRNLATPELALRKPIGEVDIQHKGFSGGGTANIINFDNGSYSYEFHVGKQFDKPGQIKKYAFIGVYKNGKELVEIACVPNSIPNSLYETTP